MPASNSSSMHPSCLWALEGSCSSSSWQDCHSSKPIWPPPPWICPCQTLMQQKLGNLDTSLSSHSWNSGKSHLGASNFTWLLSTAPLSCGGSVCNCGAASLFCGVESDVTAASWHGMAFMLPLSPLGVASVHHGMVLLHVAAPFSTIFLLDVSLSFSGAEPCVHVMALVLIGIVWCSIRTACFLHGWFTFSCHALNDVHPGLLPCVLHFKVHQQVKELQVFLGYLTHVVLHCAHPLVLYHSLVP